jgi:hypothetical protein
VCARVCMYNQTTRITHAAKKLLMVASTESYCKQNRYTNSLLGPSILFSKQTINGWVAELRDVTFAPTSSCSCSSSSNQFAHRHYPGRTELPAGQTCAVGQSILAYSMRRHSLRVRHWPIYHCCIRIKFYIRNNVFATLQGRDARYITPSLTTGTTNVPQWHNHYTEMPLLPNSLRPS